MASLAALVAAYDLDLGDVVHVDGGNYDLARTLTLSGESGQGKADLGGFFDTCLKQLDLHKKWKDAGINATIGLGSTPGMTNIAGAAMALRNRAAKQSAQAAHQKVTVDDLEKAK
mgnify:CR=1 FL=1